MLTTSPDLSSGAIDAVNAGAGNTVTLSVANSDIKPGQYMRLLDVPSQNCEARPKGSDMLVASVSGSEITFVTDITRSDANAMTNCRLTRTTTACLYNPHGTIYTRKVPEQLFPVMWVDVGGTEPDDRLQLFRDSVYGAIDFGHQMLVLMLLLGVSMTSVGACCCVCRMKHKYGGVLPFPQAWSGAGPPKDPTDKKGRSRQRSRSRGRSHSRGRRSSSRCVFPPRLSSS